MTHSRLSLLGSTSLLQVAGPPSATVSIAARTFQEVRFQDELTEPYLPALKMTFVRLGGRPIHAIASRPPVRSSPSS